MLCTRRTLIEIRRPLAPFATRLRKWHAAVAVLILVAGITGCHLSYDPDAVSVGDGSDAGPSDIDDADDGPEGCEARNLQTSLEHCGACDHSCAAGELCVDGECVEVDCSLPQGDLSGDCDPFEQDGCDFSEQACSVLLDTGTESPAQFDTVCRDLSAFGDGGTGDGCDSDPDDCGPEHACIHWPAPDARQSACSRLCDRETNAGCPDDHYCIDPFGADDGSSALSGIGFCAPRCFPQDPDFCDPGEHCVAEPVYPQGSCTPNFRCLQNGGAAGKDVGDSCDRSRLHADGCPAGTVCTPVVQPTGPPCEDDGDCNEETSCLDATLTCEPDEPELQDVCTVRCRTESDCPNSTSRCVDGVSPWRAIRHCALD